MIIMFGQEVVDYNLLHFMKRKFYDEPYQDRVLFKAQLACQNRVLSVPGSETAVFLLRDDKRHAHFFGVTHCRNSWFCPVCSARVMSQKKKELDAAFGAFRGKLNAFMITYTVPHNRWFTCEDTLTILGNSMKRFQKYAQRKKAKKFQNNAWTRFFRDMDLCHYVRIAEVTFSSHGWHPHYHALFWTPHNVSKAGEYEKGLQEYWLKIVKEETIKRFKITKQADYTEQEIIDKVDRIYASLRHKQSFFFSKEDDGKTVRRVESSDYICGWGGDQELTGSRRKTPRAENHYSQFDLLEIAAGYKHSDKMSADAAWKYFYEFAKAVKKMNFYRVKFSCTKDDNGKSIKQYIREWLLTEAYQESIKKKCTAKWEVVCWFTRSEWFKICEIDRILPIKANILYLAYDSRLLREYLESYGIFAFDNPEHSKQFLIEDIQNKVA